MPAPNGSADSDPLSQFTRGVEKHVTGDGGPLTSPLSDRALAAIAWPDAEPWETLSPTESDAAINEQLQQSR